MHSRASRPIALGPMDREPHADHAAERQPGEVDAVEAELVQRLEHVLGRGRPIDTVPAGDGGEAPCPRVSMRITRNCSASGADARRPTSRSMLPSELSSTSGRRVGRSVRYAS